MKQRLMSALTILFVVLLFIGCNAYGILNPPGCDTGWADYSITCKAAPTPVP